MPKIQEFIVSFILPHLRDYRIGSEELVAESPFLDDDVNRHFSINLESGLWQCFKSHKKGNLQQIVMHFEKCSYKKADEMVTLHTFKTIFSSKQNSSDFAKFAEPFFARTGNRVKPVTKSLEDIISEASMTGFTWSAKCSPGTLRQTALNYIKQRKLNPKDFWVAHEGPYEDRLIIPYNKKSTMFFFQARALYPGQYPKYLSPPSESCAKSSDVLYPFEWNEEYVIVCEGPIDAMSLQSVGINATATQGCYVSKTQFEALSQFSGDIVFGYDNDTAGFKGMASFNRHQHRTGRNFKFYWVAPHGKDWNDDLVEGKIDLNYYILCNKKEYNRFTDITRSLEAIQEKG